MELKININEPGILSKVHSDEFGNFVSLSWYKFITPYTPRDLGNLEQNVQIMPFKIWYKQLYAHYQYTGIVYVDPVTKAAGFIDRDGNWKSRFGVDKIPSDRQLKYQKKNEFATDHWDIKAAQAGQLNKLYQTLNNYLRKRG